MLWWRGAADWSRPCAAWQLLPTCSAKAGPESAGLSYLMLSYAMLCYLMLSYAFACPQRPSSTNSASISRPKCGSMTFQVGPKPAKSRKNAICREPLFRHTASSSPWRDKKPKKPQFWAPKSSQTPPQTLPNPTKIEPKRALGHLLGPLRPSWAQSLKKRGQKTAKESPRGSKPPPKSIPKPSPNPPKIDRKRYRKKHHFWKRFFSRFFDISTSKSMNFWIDFRCLLASKFYWFLRPFCLPNPLLFGSCSIPFNIEREKWYFIKICILPR